MVGFLAFFPCQSPLARRQVPGKRRQHFGQHPVVAVPNPTARPQPERKRTQAAKMIIMVYFKTTFTPLKLIQNYTFL
jgi:hypothetical protein